MQHQQLGLGTVLPRAQACDGVGPAVELPVHANDARRQPARSKELEVHKALRDAQICPSAAAGDGARLCGLCPVDLVGLRHAGG